MSTRNFPSGHAKRGISTFLALSALLHAGLLLSLYALRPYYDSFPGIFKEGAPVIVEVVELPPPSPLAEKPKRERGVRFADRAVSTEKETVPPARVPGKSYKEGAVSRPPSPVPGAGTTPGEEPASDSLASRTPLTPSPETGTVPKAGTTGAAGKPNLFLPKEKLGELAKKYEEEAPPGEKGKTLRLNTSELKYQKYLLNLKNVIESRWEYPLLALKNGWQGKLNIDFTVKRDGSVDYRLVKSSGYPALDDAAITAIKLASPFPPFPRDFDIEEISIHGEFQYTIIFMR